MQPPGVGDGQENLVYYSPWGRKESDTTEQLNLADVPRTAPYLWWLRDCKK